MKRAAVFLICPLTAVAVADPSPALEPKELGDGPVPIDGGPEVVIDEGFVGNADAKQLIEASASVATWYADSEGEVRLLWVSDPDTEWTDANGVQMEADFSGELSAAERERVALRLGVSENVRSWTVPENRGHGWAIGASGAYYAGPSNNTYADLGCNP